MALNTFMTMQGQDHLRIAMCMAVFMFFASADALSGMPIKGQLAGGPSSLRVCSTFGMMPSMRAHGLRGGECNGDNSMDISPCLSDHVPRILSLVVPLKEMQGSARDN